jgi:hypothetical protein
VYAINDALADQIIRASIADGPVAAGRYQSPAHASGLRALIGTRRHRSGSTIQGGIHRLTETVRSAFTTSAPAPCCAPA